MIASSDRQIQELISRRDFTHAEALIRERMDANPQSADAHYFMGVLHYFQGHLGQTVQNLKQALVLDPRHTDAAICLSVLFNDIGKYDEAKRVFDQANQSIARKHASGAGSVTGDDEVDRKFSVKHLELADLYFRYRRYDEAIDEYSKAAVLDPKTLEIRIRRAKALAKKGFLTRAIQELQQLKQEQPRFAPARIQLGLLHYSQGNLLDAELEWETVLEIEPRNREAHAYLDMCRQARGVSQGPPTSGRA